MMNFDPQKPYNKLPLIPPDFNFDDPEILKKVNSANKKLAELKAYLFAALPNPYILVNPLTIREAVASSEIEQIYTTVSDVFQADLLPDAQRSSEQKETLHYRDALIYGLDLVKEKKFINTNGFIKIQKIIEPSKSGIRKIPGTDLKSVASGEVIYTPPEGEDIIRDLLKNFEDYFNERSELMMPDLDPDPLVRLAILHYQFEAIHPFYDGNGRTGRILMVLYLVLQGLMDHPILYISGFINEYKKGYYQLIKQVTENGDWKPWILYVLDAVELQSAVTLKSLFTLKAIEEELREVLGGANVKGNIQPFLEYMISKPFYNQTDVTKQTGLSRVTATKYLNLLKNKGILKDFKSGKYIIFYHEKILEALE